MHSNTWYSKGPANQYAEFFPYLDRLWFGESFRYDDMTPDQWFVTFSGIPFGQMSEMLQDGGNRFLGMVYGTTARHSWEGVDNRKSPVPMWKFWEKYRIQEARMLGYWDPACPVKTSDPEVKATAYVKDGETIVSIGNFSGWTSTGRPSESTRHRPRSPLPSSRTSRKRQPSGRETRSPSRPRKAGCYC